MADEVRRKLLNGAASGQQIPKFMRGDKMVNIDDVGSLGDLAWMEVYRAAAESAKAWKIPVPPTPKPLIENFSDADMIMDMLRRGYAVMKLPEDGGPPEALRG